jgi:hypothetical protein
MESGDEIESNNKILDRPSNSSRSGSINSLNDKILTSSYADSSPDKPDTNNDIAPVILIAKMSSGGGFNNNDSLQLNITPPITVSPTTSTESSSSSSFSNHHLKMNRTSSANYGFRGSSSGFVSETSSTTTTTATTMAPSTNNTNRIVKSMSNSMYNNINSNKKLNSTDIEQSMSTTTSYSEYDQECLFDQSVDQSGISINGNLSKLRIKEEEVQFVNLMNESQMWIETVVGKQFMFPNDFRKSLENGVVLCE